MKVPRLRRSKGPSAGLLHESEQLRDRMMVISERVSVYAEQLQSEVDRLRDIADKLVEDGDDFEQGN